MSSKSALSLRLLFIALIFTSSLVSGFQRLVSPSSLLFLPSHQRRSRDSVQSRLFSLNKSQQTEVASLVEEGAAATTTTNDVESSSDQASIWRAQAARMRKEAEKLDTNLTLEKMQAIERKLNNKAWLERNPDQVENMQRQLETLQDKLAGPGTSQAEVEKPTTTTTTSLNGDNGAAAPNGKDDPTSAPVSINEEKTVSQPEKTPSINSERANKASTEQNKAAQKAYYEENPLSGYDQEDLELYTPVVIAIDERLPSNATFQEKLEAFRAAPELQKHFEEKIRKMLMEPIQNVQRLEELKSDYLSSSSSVEKANIKREIDRLKKTLENDSPFVYSDSIVYENLPILTEEEIQLRLEAVGALHPILQAMYKRRCGVNETEEGNLRLAIERDHFEPQLQLLEQVQELDKSSITDDMRHEIRMGILALPVSVRNHFAKEFLELEIDDDEDADVTAMIEALVDQDEEEEQWMSLEDFQDAMGKTGGGEGAEIKISFKEAANELDLPEYDDLDFLDRSRYVKEFIPSLTRLEIIHPPKEDIETLMSEVIDKSVYMVTSKPERFLGGYYIPGRNLMADSEETNSDKVVAVLQERLHKSSLKDKIDLFYIQDPSPPTDEEYELELIDRPVLVAVAKNREQLYDPSNIMLKTSVSLLGLFSVILFASATTGMQPFMKDQIEAAAAGDLSIDVGPILASASQVAASMAAIQAAHEVAHRIIAWRDKFDIGLPTLVPSIQLGLQGAITPFKSPPPSNKSMFDFAMAGPLAGLLLSVTLLVAGLDMTASMEMTAANQLPAFPAELLRSSALGGGLVEFFLGKGAVMSAAAPVVPLHPFAIAGFVGMLSNALALLPLGNTDGGRAAQTMFGRRGAYLVKILTTLILCSLGLFGLDEPRIFFSYVLFAMIWQRDLESPTLNEADELDFPRGLLGIGSAIIVLLALMPMMEA
ncbi:Probable zinc metalloprotease EGY1, chloroplastic [Seminavis robusta]|uniref:Probable zinc metalloprotease EGY1, chloroplastic n=1 Tax=Seminavis robusta TaxID=568900 RepID=A0A9N8HWD2_9STRA|nr:Probable zinc metalloprotease EGY1, chloroplastic [Seminavis robusta]|eukprot:Sro2611_g332570.1 Probable zinc metalloprotease EGY1, chloroplastic (938) ;mRNA; f:7942-10859